jgi:hypothetical protein
MQRDVERAIGEALTLANQRGGRIAAITLASADPQDSVVPLVKKVLARHGVGDAEVAVVLDTGPVRLLAVEIKR